MVIFYYTVIGSYVLCDEMHLKLKIMVVQDASVDVHVSLKWCFVTFFHRYFF